MDLIILQDGLYHLYPATKEMFAGAVRPEVVDCFSLCDIIREKLTTYLSHMNRYVMKNGTGIFYGCICN
tara:strand:- start:254 stop:460 length:207 start_codon:yes stop_codon:yes gene_type:complete